MQVDSKQNKQKTEKGISIQEMGDHALSHNSAKTATHKILYKAAP